MSKQRLTPRLLVAFALLACAAFSALADIEKSFSFSAPNVSGTGTAVFDGAGNITDLDISGTAGTKAFALQNITGTGTLDPQGCLASWDWFAQADIPRLGGGSFGYIFRFQDLGHGMSFQCFNNLENCSQIDLDLSVLGMVPEFSNDPLVPCPPAISTYAGTGGQGFSGDGGLATSASISRPWDVSLDSAGNLYIAVPPIHRILRVDKVTGVISTVAGNGNSGFSGDGGPATDASLQFPFGVAMDGAGNLYIAEQGNDRIRRVDKMSGVISTVAGNGVEGFGGDGGPATNASLSNPYDVALDGAGNLYIADFANNRIRRVDAASGLISTVAGTGSGGFNGDGGPATTANLTAPLSVALDGAANLYIAEFTGHRIRRVEVATGVITTVAGNGAQGSGGDGGSATAASIHNPSGVALDATGNLYIGDSFNHRVRRVDAGSGVITTVAGDGTPGFSGDYGPATDSSLNNPRGLALDGAGNLFMADEFNYRIRRVQGIGEGGATTRQDFDKDSDSDALLRNTGNGTWRYFSVQNQGVASNSGIGIYSGAAWTHQGNADFDGDGDADVLLRRNDGSWQVFETENGAVSPGVPMNLFLSTLWQFQGAYDFDKDGDADILCRRSDSGQWRLFEVENRQVQGSAEIFMFQNNIWAFQDIKDYDGDGDGDVLVRRTDNGKWRVFEFEAMGLVANNDPGLFNSLVWTYQSAGDMDKDGVADVVLRKTTGDWRVFDFASNASTGVAVLNAYLNTAWQHAQSGDYDADGDEDLLLRRASDGAWQVFDIENRAVQGNARMNIWTNTAFQLRQ